MVVIELSRRLKDQASDTRVQLGFRDYRGLIRPQSQPAAVGGHWKTRNRVGDGCPVYLPGMIFSPSVLQCS
jgi:hypothetical protein